MVPSIRDTTSTRRRSKAKRCLLALEAVYFWGGVDDLTIPRMILRSRAAMAWHLQESFSDRWQGASLRTAVFPLPIPFPGVFNGSGHGLSKHRLRMLVQMRLLHLVVIALMELYLDRFASFAELGGRSPTALQQTVFGRL